jgi:phenylacetate-CoA oxygenase PaaI subunit
VSAPDPSRVDPPNWPTTSCVRLANPGPARAVLEEDVASRRCPERDRHARVGRDARASSTDADALASTGLSAIACPLVELRRLEWARTIARHWLYETADAIRLEALKGSDDPELAGIAAKMEREEVYHRIHAEMWVDRLLGSEDARERLDEALDELWPYALGVLDGSPPRAAPSGEAKLGGRCLRPSPSPAGATRRSSGTCSRR